MTYLEDLHQFEDTEQAKAVSETVIDLPYDDETGLILAGPHRGLPIDDLTRSLADVYRQSGHTVTLGFRLANPWWRLFRVTPTRRLTIRDRALTLAEVLR